MLKSKMLLITVLMLSQIALSHGNALDDQEYSRKYYTISKMKVTEVAIDELGKESNKRIQRTQFVDDYASLYVPNPIDQVGRVISIARDLVALGEDVYRLVQKGKPTNTVNYAPISVIPRVNGEIVELLDTENWKRPVKRSYELAYENLYGIEVVKFKYTVIYSYGGSYNGKGAYLTSVQVIPEKVYTVFGFDFSATMKLAGIQNHGTKADPVAGATIIIEYTAENIFNARYKADSFFVTGNGYFKKI